MNYLIAYITKIFFVLFAYINQINRIKIARILGWILYKCLKFRVHIVRRNLELCFPELSKPEREIWIQKHFKMLSLSIIDRGILWYGSPQSIKNMTHIVGINRIKNLVNQKKRVILLMPHFLGIDAAGTRLSMELESIACIYQAQENKILDKIICAGRTRFNQVFLVENKNGLRKMIRHLNTFTPVIYLPDMDFGQNGSDFVPFFGIQASTLLTTAQLAKKLDILIFPVVVFIESNTGHYRIEILPELKDFPGNDSFKKATARLNVELENWIRFYPTQYYWVHRRFKTRPNKESKIY
ncbi:MAG: lysophospholipid acyltransferase family protein [Bordetella sp.]|nr:MAG: lysophospholipid acyltransferase family protein [Bordetella sp.]